MKKTFTNIAGFMMLFSVAITTFTSCQKKGCTDDDASNFDSGAKKDDGSCNFKAGVCFWTSQATANAAVASGCASEKFYVNGSLIGSSAASVYFASAPSCTSGSAHSSYDLGNSKTKACTYTITGDFPTGSSTGGDTTETVGSGTFTLDAHNSCLSIEF